MKMNNKQLYDWLKEEKANLEKAGLVPTIEEAMNDLELQMQKAAEDYTEAVHNQEFKYGEPKQ